MTYRTKNQKQIDPPNARPAAKIPTLEGVPGYQSRPDIIPGQSFRFKPMYRGRFREPHDSSSTSSEEDLSTTSNLLLPPRPARKTSSTQFLNLPPARNGAGGSGSGLKRRSRSAEDPFREVLESFAYPPPFMNPLSYPVDFSSLS